MMSTAAAWAHPDIRAALMAGVCRVPSDCGTSLRPWTPLFVPPRISLPVINIMLAALVQLNIDYLKEHPNTPLLYRSGVRYVAELPGQEQWLTIPFIRLRGQGDCEDLACWRVAELRLRLGEHAEPFAISTPDPQNPKRGVYHIRVRRGKRGPDGKRLIEDPSAALGMMMPMLGLTPDNMVEVATAQNPYATGSFFETFITDGERL